MITKVSANNNNYHPNFKANIEFLGSFKDIPKPILAQWRTVAKSIGCDTDSIIIKFGKTAMDYTRAEMESRSIEVTTTINNEIIDSNKYIGFNGTSENATDLTIKKVNAYLNSFTQKVKTLRDNLTLSDIAAYIEKCTKQELDVLRGMIDLAKANK